MRIETMKNYHKSQFNTIFQPFASMMRIETYVDKTGTETLFDFQPFASMMRIETVFQPIVIKYKCLSAIRQYDEDWNNICYFSCACFCFFQPFASMMRIETTRHCNRAVWTGSFSHSPVWWGLKQQRSRYSGGFLHFQPFASMMRIETLNVVIDRAYLADFQPFASMMRIETSAILYDNLIVYLTFSHSPVWWGLKHW